MADIVCQEPKCGAVNDGTQVKCRECFSYLPEPDPEPQQQPSEPASPTASPTTCPRCTAELRPELDRCPYCPMSATLVFPWGRVTLYETEPIIVGRHADSPVAIDLAGDEWDNISRRHALFTLTSSGVQVEDLGSTNGTFVNGRSILRCGPVDVAPTDVVHLGTDPKLTITIGGE